MKIYEEKQVRYFDFWAGAKDTAEKIDEAGAWEIIEDVLNDLYPGGLDETELNDLFWFEPEAVLEWAGIGEEEEEEEEEEMDEEAEYCERMHRLEDWLYI